MTWLLLFACSPEGPATPVVVEPKVEAVAKSGRQSFHDGRFSVDFPTMLPAPKMTTKGKHRSSAINIPLEETLWAITFKESLEDGPSNKVDSGMVKFVLGSVVKSTKGETDSEKKVPLPGLKTEALVTLIVKPSGEREHLAVFPADDLTLAMVTATDRSVALETEAFVALLETFRVEKPSKAKPPAAP